MDNKLDEAIKFVTFRLTQAEENANQEHFKNDHELNLVLMAKVAVYKEVLTGLQTIKQGEQV